MGGPRGWEIPFPPFLTHPAGEKSPHGWPPWVGNPFPTLLDTTPWAGNPFPTLLDTSRGQEIPFPPFGDTLYTFAFYFLSMKKTTITILIILAIPIALFALRSGRDDSTAEFVNVRPDAIPSRSIYPGRGTAVHPKLIAPNYQIIAENNLFRPLGWRREAPPTRQTIPNARAQTDCRNTTRTPTADLHARSDRHCPKRLRPDGSYRRPTTQRRRISPARRNAEGRACARYFG